MELTKNLGSLVTRTDLVVFALFLSIVQGCSSTSPTKAVASNQENGKIPLFAETSPSSIEVVAHLVEKDGYTALILHIFNRSDELIHLRRYPNSIHASGGDSIRTRFLTVYSQPRDVYLFPGDGFIRIVEFPLDPPLPETISAEVSFVNSSVGPVTIKLRRQDQITPHPQAPDPEDSR